MARRKTYKKKSLVKSQQARERAKTMPRGENGKFIKASEVSTELGVKPSVTVAKGPVERSKVAVVNKESSGDKDASGTTISSCAFGSARKTKNEDTKKSNTGYKSLSPLERSMSRRERHLHLDR